MGQTPRQLAPGCDALGLHQLLALRCELGSHVVEAAREHGDFVAPALRYLNIPVACGNLFGRVSQLLDRTRHTGRNPEAEGDSQQDAARCDPIGDRTNVLLSLHHAGA